MPPDLPVSIPIRPKCYVRKNKTTPHESGVALALPIFMEETAKTDGMQKKTPPENATFHSFYRQKGMATPFRNRFVKKTTFPYKAHTAMRRAWWTKHLTAHLTCITVSLQLNIAQYSAKSTVCQMSVLNRRGRHSCTA